MQRVCDGGADHHRCQFANAGWSLVGRDDMYFHVRHLIDAQQLVSVEV
jgi:hypothetical protein